MPWHRHTARMHACTHTGTHTRTHADKCNKTLFKLSPPSTSRMLHLTEMKICLRNSASSYSSPGIPILPVCVTLTALPLLHTGFAAPVFCNWCISLGRMAVCVCAHCSTQPEFLCQADWCSSTHRDLLLSLCSCTDGPWVVGWGGPTSDCCEFCHGVNAFTVQVLILLDF